MRFLTVCASLFGIALMMIVSAGSANAQATRTWVSGVGDDANPCSRTAPCKTFAGAISKTAAGGEINCLDPGGFGAVTITKAMTINCEETLGSVLVSGTNGIVVQAGATDVVMLKGIEIEGLRQTAGPGLSGVRFTSGAELHIHKFQIRDFANNGIDIEATTNGAKVFLADGYISSSGGSTATNAGILVRPASGISINVSINRVQVEACANGIFMDGSAGAGASNMNVRDSVFAGSPNNGIAVSSTAGAFNAGIFNSMMNSNVVAGVGAAGGSVTVRLGNNTIANNVTGVSNSGATVQSYKNNMFAGNASDGTPITAVPGNSGTLQ